MEEPSHENETAKAACDVPQSERDRLRIATERRSQAGGPDRYSVFKADALYGMQERERQVLRALAKAGTHRLSAQKILDVGCGFGPGLRQFIHWGARPENLCGIEILPERAAVARQLCPSQVTVVDGDGRPLPWNDSTFDIVSQWTVFTSILDAERKRGLAEEMLRVLKPDGLVLWHDFRFNNPRNPDVQGIGKKEIHRLFPGCSVHGWATALLPPLARAVAPWSVLLTELLGKFPPLCSHYVAVIQKPRG